MHPYPQRHSTTALAARQESNRFGTWQLSNSDPPTTSPTSCYEVDRELAALENTLLSADARVFIVAIAASATNTSRRPYSVKSWPSSSFHSLTKRFFICLFPSILETTVPAIFFNRQ